MQSPSASDDDATEFIDFLNIVYWGFVWQTVLFGVSICQGFLYFSNYNDRFPLKAYVSFLLFLDVSSTIAWTTGLHTDIVQNWGASVSLSFSSPFLVAESVSTLTMTFLTQMFFAHRVYLLHPSRPPIPVIIVIFAMIALGGGITRITLSLTTSSDAISAARVKVANLLENGFAAVGDTVATIAMCLKFVESALDTRRMASVLRRLMIYTVNRGITVTLVHISIVAFYWCAPEKLYWAPLHMCAGKLYVNTLLAMLNARQGLRSDAGFTDRSDGTEQSSTFGVKALVDPTDVVLSSIDLAPAMPISSIHRSSFTHKEALGSKALTPPPHP
ncbi:hypothetical protein BD410DRAFT_796569 [Rickenella mellea]|uniref:DUF6534 domain-containing protein n=1 Tax=Rickenella mellea TaxID=50990 RepID=A0A4Y7PLB7_9AGAM|nr:hypothetical protein BD410DRAFT_796569 [Rickenella mellea]